MANVTYSPIQTQSVSGTSTTTITFSSLPAGYTDLVLIGKVNGTNSNDAYLRFNGDSSNIYADCVMRGTGTGSVTSTRDTFVPGIDMGPISNVTGSDQLIIELNIFSYNNPNITKTTLLQCGNAATHAWKNIGVWRSNEAITSLSLVIRSGVWKAGTIFSLYGIEAAPATVVSSPKAVGGAVSTDGTYWYHTFRGSGVFTPSRSLTCDVLTVAGGGSGGWPYAGGGGAGGVVYSYSQAISTAQTVTVGGGAVGLYNNGNGLKGSNSQFGSLTAAVGGGGGSGDSGTNNSAGGSGGGGSAYAYASSNNAGGTATAGQGNNGGTGSANGATYSSGGGGGGSAASGGNATSTVAGNGGNGVTTYATWLNATNTGVNGFIAAGGGGGTNAGSYGTGGYGGGGDGAANGSSGGVAKEGTAAVPNTGSGGGGGAAGNAPQSPKNAGSGLVIVRYAI
jgi:hypothetical protein